MATYLYVNDSGSNTWQLGVNDDGTLSTVPVAPSSPIPVLLDDSDTGVSTWQVIATLGTGDPESSPQMFDPGQPTEIMLQSPGGYFFILQVHSDGSLFTTLANVPGSLPGLPCGVPGKVTVTGPSELITVIDTDVSATGDPVLLAEVLYQYANLDIPFSPNDPGLFYTYQNTDQLLHKTLAARFFNLLDEYSSPIFFDVGSSVPSVTGLASTGTCLDPRLFGAVGDGVTDDTVAVQAALDKAHENYLQIQAAIAASGADIVAGIKFGPTIVCIPSDEVCLVTPRWWDQRDRSGALVPNTGVTICQPGYASVLGLGGGSPGQHGAGFVTSETQLNGTPPNPYYPVVYQSINNPGMAALLIDDGVTLLIDGGVKLGRSTAIIPTLTVSGAQVTAEQFMRANFVAIAYVIQNKNAFIQGPFAGVPTFAESIPEAHSYQEWISGSLRQAPQEDTFTGNGSATSFTLSQIPIGGIATVSTSDQGALTEGTDYTIAGTALTFLPGGAEPVPGNGVLITVDYLFQDPGYELGPRNKNILITGSGFIDCGADVYHTYPTVALPAFVSTVGICFSKCDESEVNNVTIRSFVQGAVYWGHSEQAKIQNLRLSDQREFLNGTQNEYGAITCDVLRKSAVFQNFGTSIASTFIQLWLCHSISVTHNKVQQSGGGNQNLIFSTPSGLQFGWLVNEDFATDCDMSMNEITYNRASPWQPNVLYEGSAITVPTAAYTNPIAPGPQGISDYYTQWSAADNNGGNSGYVGGGFSSSSEPAWNNQVPDTLTEPVYQVVQEFLGNGGDIAHDGTASRDYKPFLAPTSWSSFNLYKNGVLLTQGVDYTVIFFAYVRLTTAAGLTDVITASYPTQLYWTPGSGPDEGSSYLTTLVLFQQEVYTLDGTFTNEKIFRQSGMRFEHNIVTDNDAPAVTFDAISNSSISYNMFARNEGWAIKERYCPFVPVPGFPAVTLDCPGTQILQNTNVNYPNDASQPIQTCPDDTVLTIDNPSIDPTTITRGGLTQSFHNIVKGETPSGVVDGTNAIFTLAHTPVTGTLVLLVNGLKEFPSNYTVTGNTITFATAPALSSVLIANYQW